MSAAAPRSEKLAPTTDELTQPAETGLPGRLEARPVIEVTRVTEAASDAISDHGMTPLMRAACDGLAGTVQALLDRGAEVNAKRSDGFNATVLAAFFGHSQVVWLLLEHGADLAATGRSETPPERWADARGFFHIGDMLREARVTEQLEVSCLSTAVIAESARFSRPAKDEKLQVTGGPGLEVEGPVIDEATNSEMALAMRPAPVAEESTPTKSESTANIVPNDNVEHAHQRGVIKPPLRAVKTLPEIEDPPPLVVPEFHPGSAFFSRITSSRKNLAALIVAVLLLGSGMAVFLFPQIRKSSADRRTEAVTKTTNLPTEPSNPVAESATNVSGPVEPSSAATRESTTAPASKEAEEPAAQPTATKSEELPSRVGTAEVSERSSASVATPTEPDSGAHRGSSTSAGNGLSEIRENKSESSAAPSKSRFVASARKQGAVSRAVKFKQQTSVEEQPRPAPLSVEASHSSGAVSAPARSGNELSDSQPSPLSIISGKPKPKVIQWP